MSDHNVSLHELIELYRRGNWIFRVFSLFEWTCNLPHRNRVVLLHMNIVESKLSFCIICRARATMCDTFRERTWKFPCSYQWIIRNNCRKSITSRNVCDTRTSVRRNEKFVCVRCVVGALSHRHNLENCLVSSAVRFFGNAWTEYSNLNKKSMCGWNKKKSEERTLRKWEICIVL